MMVSTCFVFMSREKNQSLGNYQEIPYYGSRFGGQRVDVRSVEDFGRAEKKMFELGTSVF